MNNNQNYMNNERLKFLAGVIGFNVLGESQVKIITCTPEMAKKMLSFSAGNRNLDQRRVAVICESILSSKKSIFLQGNPVTFDKNGTHKEGQHRLYGIIKANIPAKIAVQFVSGADDDSLQFIDRNRVRALSEAFNLSGKDDFKFKMNSSLIGIAKYLLYLSGVSRLDEKVLNQNIIFDVLKHYENEIFYFQENAKCKERKIMTSPVSAAIIQTIKSKKINEKELLYFIDCLSKGARSAYYLKGKNAIVLREWLEYEKYVPILNSHNLPVRMSPGVISAKAIFYAVQRVICRTIAGEEIKAIDMGIDKTNITVSDDATAKLTNLEKKGKYFKNENGETIKIITNIKPAPFMPDLSMFNWY